MAAIAEHLSFPETKSHLRSRRAKAAPSPVGVRHACFVAYLALACGAAALLIASREATKASSRQPATAPDPRGEP